MTVDETVNFFYNLYSAPDQHAQFDKFKQVILDRPGAVVIELGTGSGISASMFLSAGAEVWSVDLEAFDRGWKDKFHSLTADDISERAQGWLPAECDVLFIDSAHTKEHTLKELRLYVSRVRAGGIVMCHDTHFSPGGGELPEPTGEVAEALTVWCDENNLTWEDIPGSFGLGIVLI